MENLIQLFKQHNDGVAIIDNNGLVSFWNPSLEEITGIAEKTAVGRYIWDLQSELTPNSDVKGDISKITFDAEFTKKLWESKEIFAVAKNKGWQKREFCFQKKDTSLVFVEQHFYVFTCNDKDWFCTFIYDITNRKKNEKIIEEQSATLTHDLKSPLNAILGFSDKSVYQNANPEELSKFFDHIHASGIRLLKTIDSTLLRSKAERGEKVIKKITSLPKILSTVRQEYEATIKSVGIEINYDFASMLPGESLNVPVEETLFQSMLCNLLKNGAEATPDDDPDKKVVLKISWEIGKIILSIHNKGEVPKEIRSRLFQKYVTFGKPDGNGLGLSMAKAIIESHDGTITYVPEPGGTTFRIELPLT